MAERSVQPPLTARWVWPDRLVTRPWNQYVFFRRALALPGRPRRALIRISADARYRLFVNETPVHVGPARSFPQRICVDEIDLAAWLSPGANVIAVIAHQFGTGTFQSLWREASGFLFDGRLDCDTAAVDLDTPGEWLARVAGGWRRDVGRMSIQMGFQEHYDADADPPGWMRPDFVPDESWATPHALGPHGVHPWLAPAARSVPLLTQTPARFARVAGQFRGENARGHKVAEDIYRLVESEPVRKTDEGLDEPARLLSDDDPPTTVGPTADGQFVALVLEAEDGYCTGHIRLDISEAAGGEIIDIVANEALSKNNWPAFNSVIGGGAQTAVRYRCRAGAQTWETFSYIGLRYVALVFRNVEKPLKLRFVGLRRVGAAVDAGGSFECSDETLTAIWRMCQRTQRACLLDTFVDCPWREQAMWWGDARVQAMVTAHAFGDASVLEYGIRLMAQSQAEDGSLHAHPPSDWPTHRLPDFMCTWVSTLWDHYRLTGRIDLIRESLPAMHRLFDFLARHGRPDGLIGGFDGWWVFLDWAELHKTDYSAVLNLQYLLAATHAAELCALAGDPPAAQRYRALAGQLRDAVEHCFWDEKRQVFRDGLDAAVGKPLEKVSQQANALAILLGLRPREHEAIAREALLKPAKQSKPSIVTSTPFFYAYVLEALIAVGLRKEALALIREKWGRWVDDGFATCGETWKPVPLSHCHAWSASPLYLLMQEILGIRAIEPGWKKFRIDPLPADLEFARGALPTVNGLIKVDWEQVGGDQLAVRLEIPEGLEAEFVSPNRAVRLLRAGVHEFQT